MGSRAGSLCWVAAPECPAFTEPVQKQKHCPKVEGCVGLGGYDGQLADVSLRHKQAVSVTVLQESLHSFC